MKFSDWLRLDVGALFTGGKIRIASPKAAKLNRRPAYPPKGIVNPTEVLQQIQRIVSCGAPIASGLTPLEEDCPNPHTAGYFRQIRTAMEQGAPLAEALETLNLYPRYYIDLIRAGEASGELEAVLSRLQESQTNRMLLNLQFIRQIYYIGVVLFIFLTSLNVIGDTVINLATDLGQMPYDAMPFTVKSGYFLFHHLGLFVHHVQDNLNRTFDNPFEFLSSLYNKNPLAAWMFLTAGLFLAALLFVGIVMFCRRYRPQTLFIRYTPVLNRIAFLSEWGVAAGIMAQMLYAGYPELRAVEAAAGARIAPDRKKILTRIAEHMQQGACLYESMAREKTCPKVLTAFTSLGESSGNLAETLERAAYLLDQQAFRFAKWTAAICFPILILILGFLVMSTNSYVFYTFSYIAESILESM